MIIFSSKKISEKWKWNLEDGKRILKNALVFLSPAIIIYLSQIQASLSGDFNLSDLLPNEMTKGAVWAWFLSTVLDAFKKLKEGK